jgi:hypothetical protein
METIRDFELPSTLSELIGNWEGDFQTHSVWSEEDYKGDEIG